MSPPPSDHGGSQCYIQPHPRRTGDLPGPWRGAAPYRPVYPPGVWGIAVPPRCHPSAQGGHMGSRIPGGRYRVRNGEQLVEQLVPPPGQRAMLSRWELLGRAGGWPGGS